MALLDGRFGGLGTRWLFAHHSDLSHQYVLPWFVRVNLVIYQPVTSDMPRLTSHER